MKWRAAFCFHCFSEFTYWVAASRFWCLLLARFWCLLPAWGIVPSIILRAGFSKTEMKHTSSMRARQSFDVSHHRAEAQAGRAGLRTSWQRQPALGRTGHTPETHLEQAKCRWCTCDLPEPGHICRHPVKAIVLHTLQTPGAFVSVSPPVCSDSFQSASAFSFLC